MAEMSDEVFERFLETEIPKLAAQDEAEMARLDDAEPVELPEGLRERILEKAREVGSTGLHGSQSDEIVIDGESYPSNYFG